MDIRIKILIAFIVIMIAFISYVDYAINDLSKAKHNACKELGFVEFDGVHNDNCIKEGERYSIKMECFGIIKKNCTATLY